MKFRNRFLRFGAPSFQAFSNPCLMSVDAGEGENGEGGEGGGGGGETITVSPADLQKMIDDGIAKATKNNAENVNVIDKIDKERSEKEKSKSELEKTKQTIAFDMGFDGFIDDNSRSFTIDKAKFRESAKGLEGDELERVLSVTAAKDFFRKEEHLELLPERDREYIKNSVIGLADNAIDYRKAFQLIEDALHIKKRVTENNSFRKNSKESNIDNTDTPNVTAYLEKCAAAGRPKTA